jgi:hypothetical protein
VAENDYTIDHELQEAVAVVGVDPTDLLRDDAGQSHLKKPIADAVNFSTLRHPIIEEAQEHVDPVEDNPLRLNLFGLGLKDGEHSDQIEFPGLHHVWGELRIQWMPVSIFVTTTCGELSFIRLSFFSNGRNGATPARTTSRSSEERPLVDFIDLGRDLKGRDFETRGGGFACARGNSD